MKGVIYEIRMEKFIYNMYISLFVNSAVNTNMYTEKISTHKHIYDKNMEKLQINNRSQ